jgi:hypothetical protein
VELRITAPTRPAPQSPGPATVLSPLPRLLACVPRFPTASLWARFRSPLPRLQAVAGKSCYDCVQGVHAVGHKVLKDHAFVFCQMFMGWRMADDLETFATLSDGQLYIDVLEGSCRHSEAGCVQTHIAGEIRAWFVDRLAKHKIQIEEIEKASLTVTMKNTIPRKHKRGITLDWTCDAAIRTKDREYKAHLAEPLTWLPVC